MPTEIEAPDRPAATLRIPGIAAAATRTFLGLLLLAMLVLNVANAVFRYLFGLVLIRADELLVFAEEQAGSVRANLQLLWAALRSPVIRAQAAD